MASSAGFASEPEEITVFTAASLTGAFSEIGGIYENETNIHAVFNFDGSQALRTQIENGAYADVFASANKKQMNALKNSELMNNSSIVIFAKNKISLIVPKDSSYGQDYKTKVLPNVISQETTVNYVVTKVALGEADVGFAYVSDVTEELAGKVDKIEIPDEYNIIAEYPIGLLQESKYPTEGMLVHESGYV